MANFKKFSKSSRYDYLKSLFLKFGTEIKMEKSIIKKNVHLSEKEKQYVARLIQDGGTLEDISKWHKTRFGKPIARSKLTSRFKY